MHPLIGDTEKVSKLAGLLRSEQELLLASWRSAVRQLPSASQLDVPTLNDHIPDFLEELALALELRSKETTVEALADGSPPDHGEQRVVDGFDIAEVVSEYNILRGCIHDLAEEHDVLLLGPSFHILNTVFDHAIGLAVTSFANQRAEEIKARREEYLSFVAHDLRTPLSAITLATSMLDLNQREGESVDENDQLVQALYRNVAKLKGMVDRVLEENAYVVEGHPRTAVKRQFDLWPMVQAVVLDIRPLAAEREVRLINQIPPDLVVHGDAGMLDRVFQNLLGNAVRHTAVGEILIGAEQQTGGSVVCWVQDTGSGIPKELLMRVFEKGEGEPGRGANSGLGLAIVRSFVEAHGGTVSVESEIGKGTVVRFTLPTPEGVRA